MIPCNGKDWSWALLSVLPWWNLIILLNVSLITCSEVIFRDVRKWLPHRLWKDHWHSNMGSSQHFTCPSNQMPPTMSPLGSNLSLLLLISFNFFFFFTDHGNVMSWGTRFWCIRWLCWKSTSWSYRIKVLRYKKFPWDCGDVILHWTPAKCSGKI